MKMAVARRVLVGLLVCLTAVAAGAQTEKTTTLTGTVVEVDGGTLIVKMDNGEIRMFTPPADRVFVIDGKELKLSALKPGTKLNATVKETTTTSTVQTVETLEGTVAYAAGTAVILTLPTNERRQYNIKSTDPVKFYDQNGKEITVFDLRKNMKIKATRITEAPRVELAQNVAVTGTAPTQAAAAAPAAAAPKPAAAPAQPAAASSSQTASTSGAEGEKPKKLPTTASPLPLLGLIGLASLAAGLGLTVRRRGI
jgi:Cu/Ag efflux protein CusF